MAIVKSSLMLPHSPSPKRDRDREPQPPAPHFEEVVDEDLVDVHEADDCDNESVGISSEDFRDLAEALKALDSDDDSDDAWSEVELQELQEEKGASHSDNQNHEYCPACFAHAKKLSNREILTLFARIMSSIMPEAQLLLGGVIAVDVGTGATKTEFFVHENLITGRSDFFKNALKPGKFIEGDTKRVHLPMDQEYDFACLLHWLYTGTLKFCLTPVLPPDSSDDTSSDMVKHSGSDTSTDTQPSCSSCGELDCQLHHGIPVDRLFELWILGDKLQVAGFQDDIAAKLIELGSWNAAKDNIHHMPSNMTLKYVYDNTLASSSLRRLAVDLAVLTRHRCDLERSLKTLPEEIVRDIAVATIKMWKADARHHTSPPFEVLRANELSYKVRGRSNEYGGPHGFGCGYSSNGHEPSTHRAYHDIARRYHHIGSAAIDDSDYYEYPPRWFRT